MKIRELPLYAVFGPRARVKDEEAFTVAATAALDKMGAVLGEPAKELLFGVRARGRADTTLLSVLQAALANDAAVRDAVEFIDPSDFEAMNESEMGREFGLTAGWGTFLPILREKYGITGSGPGRGGIGWPVDLVHKAFADYENALRVHFQKMGIVVNW